MNVWNFKRISNTIKGHRNAVNYKDDFNNIVKKKIIEQLIKSNSILSKRFKVQTQNDWMRKVL